MTTPALTGEDDDRMEDSVVLTVSILVAHLGPLEPASLDCQFIVA